MLSMISAKIYRVSLKMFSSYLMRYLAIVTVFGSSSGNWRGLRSNGVNLMIALKPVDDSASIHGRQGIDLYFPEELEHIELCRIYRCTQRISQFYEEVITKIITTTSNYYGSQINKSSNSNTPGHETLGERPEVLLLLKCPCKTTYCSNAQEHLLFANKAKIFALLRRIRTKVKAKDEKITFIIDTKDARKCVDWIEVELKKNLIDSVDVKTIEQCRGMEFPILVTITDLYSLVNTSIRSSSLMDTWTRVTAFLFIIHMEDSGNAISPELLSVLKFDIEHKYGDAFSLALKSALQKGLAKVAEEIDVQEAGKASSYLGNPRFSQRFSRKGQNQKNT